MICITAGAGTVLSKELQQIFLLSKYNSKIVYFIMLARQNRCTEIFGEAQR